MARVLTNNVSLSFAQESSLGVAPTSGWRRLQPNTINMFGAEIKSVERNPIDNDRQRQEGTVVDLDSRVEFQSDLTMDHLISFLEGFLFCKFVGPGDLADGAPYLPTAVTSTGYTVAAAGDIANNLLIFAQGFATAANNGLKLLAGTSTATEIKTAGLTAETGTAARNATVTVAGVQGASGDIVAAATGLTSTLLDFTTLGLTVGQFIKIGGSTTATQFDVSANCYARVTAIAAGALTLDMATGTLATDTAASKTIQLLFGRYVRNVAVDNVLYIERSYSFENAFPNLQNPDGTGPEYEYSRGNFANEINTVLPLTDKAGVTWSFIGTDTPSPTTTRDTGASAAALPIMVAPLNTSSQIAWMRISESDMTSRASYFKSLSMKLTNNVSPEKTLGTLGGTFMNAGTLEVDVDADILFTDSQIPAAIRENRSMVMNWCIANAEGGAFFSLPSVKLTGGKKDYPEHETVKLQTTARAFKDPLLGITLGVSLFPYLP